MSHASARAYEGLRKHILTGVHPAGARLREEQLAETLGLSRTPVREALRRLEADGLVQMTPHRGAQVTTWSTEDFDEIFELRTLLEGHAALKAATRGDVDVSGLRSLCEAMEQRLDALDDRAYEDITRLNLEFHRSLHRAAGERLLPDLVSRVIEVPLVRRTFDQYSAAELQRSFTQHRELVEALNAGDGQWAQAVMHAHIRAARTALLRAAGRFDEEGEPTP
ncbi:FCD domain-containing protein [Allosaccharopolyspora coralli]|uniref:FCD domain-containing protein n=1 Tax=Allosaccharopolyspora coralli TaxID=2665642 RepID=A0A5Q3QGF4_9PSEU|nr:GntR family transcriptional regulator [Allosaccharopolyspora coralli]QGK70549.1 FCD domain-containing protein [Allosaccharopolyspora coralli]